VISVLDNYHKFAHSRCSGHLNCATSEQQLANYIGQKSASIWDVTSREYR